MNLRVTLQGCRFRTISFFIMFSRCITPLMSLYVTAYIYYLIYIVYNRLNKKANLRKLCIRTDRFAISWLLRLRIFILIVSLVVDSNLDRLMYWCNKYRSIEQHPLLHNYLPALIRLWKFIPQWLLLHLRY